MTWMAGGVRWALVAAVLLLTGALTAMQTFQLPTGLPLGIILLAMWVSLSQALDLDIRDVKACRGRGEGTLGDSRGVTGGRGIDAW